MTDTTSIFDRIAVWRNGPLWSWSARPPANDSVYGGYETEQAAINAGIMATLTSGEIIQYLKSELLDAPCPGGAFPTRECVGTDTCGCGRAWFFSRTEAELPPTPIRS